jgi:hypothetical protein
MTKKKTTPKKSTKSKNDVEIEPTVLDWVKSLVRGKPLDIPEEGKPAAAVKRKRPAKARVAVEKEAVRLADRIKPARIRLPAALILAFFAQFGLEDKSGGVSISVILYACAALLIIHAVRQGDFELEKPEKEEGEVSSLAFRPILLITAVVLSVLTFLTSSENQFRLSTIIFWIGALVTVMLALWDGELPFVSVTKRWRAWLENPSFKIVLDGWRLAVIAGFGVTLFFRLVHLSTVPAEMVSDHAEKLLDVIDVLNGQFRIFFPRNTGREALQFYMGAAAAKWLNLGISHMTLKIGTVLAGIITVPYIYLIGKEVAGREVGLGAMVLSGIAYWPNVISRVGLRFPLYPLFVAPAMYYLIRGIRRQNRNDFLLCGLTVGIGLHGYSPIRVLPIVIALGVLVYLLHRQAKGQRWALVTWLVGTGIVALIVILPLLRVALDIPDQIISRMATRMGSAERPLGAPAIVIYLVNAWKALLMFGWDNGVVWVNSIPYRPAFDWITAASFYLGVVFLIARYIKHRNWLDLFLLLSIPILQLPSTLSLAFPSENPATNRAAGAFVPGFVIAALPLAALPALARAQWKEKRYVVYSGGLALLLFLISAGSNYNLVFNEYADLFRRSAWNTTDAGRIIREYAESYGEYETAHVVAYPHWMDTRLVGINAGYPEKDYAIWPDDFEDLLTEPRSMLFILNPQDESSLQLLEELFPHGSASVKRSDYEGKDLVVFFVPADKSRGPLPTLDGDANDDF